MPAAAVVWAAALATLVVSGWAGAVVVAGAAGAALAARAWGQAVLVGGLGAASAAVAWVRLRIARSAEFAGELTGRVAQPPRALAGSGHLVRVQVPGYPGQIPVFTRELPEGIVAGTTVRAVGSVSESNRPGTVQVTLSGSVDVVAPPQGMAALAAHVRATFADTVAAHVVPGARGVIPGMVLGETSLQTPADAQAYIDSGLSHLSVVSGSNVAIVTTAAVLVAAALGLGLRARIALAGAALMSFAALVGPEPSVLRASVTGLVALVAVVSSSIAEPLHALSLAVVGLILVDSNLAVSYGFALSVAATAGIVALSPLIYRALAPLRWPDILTRAVAVALAADAATAPLVALMAGRVSLVAVAANILVAPVVAPITVIGLAAALISLLPGSLEVPLLWVVEPLAWWVHTVATAAASMPGATATAQPLEVLVAYGWVLAGLCAGRPGVTLAIAGALCCLALIAPALTVPAAPAVVPPDRAATHVVNTEEEVEPVPAGTQLVVVLETGSPLERPVRTTGGIPVLYPNRGGPTQRGLRGQEPI